MGRDRKWLVRRREDPHAPWRPGALDDVPLPERRVARAAGRWTAAVARAGRTVADRRRPSSRRKEESNQQAPPSTVEPSLAPLLLGLGLTRTYPGPQGVTALQGVSLSATNGEFLALLGPSGSGKSTLLGLLAGLDHPEAGQVRWRDRPLDRLSHQQVLELRRRRMGIVFQSFGLLPILSALENVALPLRVAGVRPSDAMDRASEWLDHLGLTDRYHNRVFELSTGQQQRVAVARSLVTGPEIVLADEPIAEVDSENAGVILEALSRVSERGGAVVCATHNPAVLAFATRAILLRDGRIEAEGAPGDVVARLSTD